MPTITVTQLRTSATPLNAILTDAALTKPVSVTLNWVVDDAPSQRSVEQQVCTLTLGGGNSIAARVSPEKRSYSFRLPQGTRLTSPLTATVEVNLAERTAAPAAPRLDGLSSAALNIGSPSVVIPEREALSTVYGELNTELRRTRTLYESFLVAVTAALATLYSKKELVIGASHRGLMLVGLGALATIVLYMMWAVSRRYTRAVAWVGHLEQALGVRDGDPPEDLMPDHVAWWTQHAWPHTLWAIMLTLYVGVLVASAGYLLTARPDAPAPPAPAQTQTIICDCARPDGSNVSGAGKAGGKTSTSSKAAAAHKP